MKSLVRRTELSDFADTLMKGSDHPMLKMDVDILKTINLEDIHMKIACGKVDEEPQVEMQEFIINMPEEFRKKYVKE